MYLETTAVICPLFKGTFWSQGPPCDGRTSVPEGLVTSLEVQTKGEDVHSRGQQLDGAARIVGDAKVSLLGIYAATA